jgi:hypothetical protein
MRQHTSCNDEALVLLVHGELALGARLHLLVHLAGCSACRARLRQYSQVSVKLASGLGQVGQLPRLRSVLTGLPLPAPLWLISGLTLAILGSVSFVSWQWLKLNPRPHYSTLQQGDSGECATPAPGPRRSRGGHRGEGPM